MNTRGLTTIRPRRKRFLALVTESPILTGVIATFIFAVIAAAICGVMGA